MTALEEFETGLAAIIGRPTALRPFVCDGSPLECRVFVAGFNPASMMSAGFWQFWNPQRGFDKASWLQAYKAERMSRPLKPGKTRRHPVSNSRRVIEWILEETGPVRCLETNIYAAATEQAADLEREQRLTAPFDYLLATINPRVIVVHGVEAAEYIGKRDLRAHVIETSHFSRGWSQAQARDLGKQIRSLF
jgi:hypothetical protein